MKIRVKKEFELHSNHKTMEDDVLDLITINYENDSLFLIVEKCGHIFNVYFKDEFDANEHIEFDYEEEVGCSTDIWIKENESNKRIAEICTKKDEEIDIDSIEDLRYETVIETLGKCDCYTGNEYYCLKTLSKNDENLLKSNAENHRKINELIKAVKQINNKLKEKEYCECCGVELTEQNKALSNMCNECKYGLDRD